MKLPASLGYLRKEAKKVADAMGLVWDEGDGEKRNEEVDMVEGQTGEDLIGGMSEVAQRGPSLVQWSRFSL